MTKDNKETQGPVGSAEQGITGDSSPTTSTMAQIIQHEQLPGALDGDADDLQVMEAKTLSALYKGDRSSAPGTAIPGSRTELENSKKMEEKIKSHDILLREPIPPVQQGEEEPQISPSPAVPPTTLVRSAQQNMAHPVGAYAVSGDVALSGDIASQQEIPIPTSEPTTNQETPDSNHLVVANPVQENDDENPRDLPMAESVDADDAARKEAARIREIKTYALIAIIAILALVGILVIVLYPNKQEPVATVNPEISGPTSSPSQISTTLEQFYLSLLPADTVSVILDAPNSSQALAFEWLMEDLDGALDLTHDRIKQRFALATLFFATAGEMWVAKENWLNHSVDECTWEIKPDFGEKAILSAGFTGFLAEMHPSTEPAPTPCNENGMIQHLWLDQNNLQGTLPLEIYMLTWLKTISLGGNNLPGTISSHIGQLTLLEGWASRHAMFKGKIPTEIGLLSNLRSLVLFNNDFAGPVPTQIWNLTNLETIAWAQNANLKGTLPSELGAISKLRWLGLYACGFKGIVVTFVESANFEVEHGSPCMHINVTTGTIPTTIGLLKQLEWIEILHNRFSGTLPSEIGQLTKATMLSSYDNLFKGTLPTEFGLLTEMTLLRMGGNQLTGPVPSELGLLTNLDVRLNLDNNQFTGKLPTQLGLLTKVTGLDLHENQLSGPLPSELGLLTILGTLTCANNSLSGSIPQELSALQPSLYALSLEGNSLLTGIIPEGLCSLNGTCDQDALRVCESFGLTFDCGSLCGCNCSCSMA